MIEATAEDYDDMLHALGRPDDAHAETYRNYYATERGSDIAERFTQSGWWDFRGHMNDGSDAIYSVNKAGRDALAKWLEVSGQAEDTIDG